MRTAPPPPMPCTRQPIGRRGLARIAAGALALPFVARPAHAAINWTLFCQLVDQSSVRVRGLRRMSDRLREATAGGLVISVHTAGTLPIDANNVLHSVTSGQVEMGEDATYTTSIAPGALMRLPMLITSAAEFDTAAKILRPYLVQTLAARNIVLLGHARTAQQQFWSRQKATRMADMHRQRVRVLSFEQAEFVRHFGGLHSIMPTVAMDEALKEGKVDGTFTTAASGGRVWKTILKHAYLSGPNYTDAVIIAGQAALRALPAGMEQALHTAATEAAAWIASTADAEEQQTLRALAAEGLTITPADAEDVQEGIQKLTGFWDSWVRLRGAETDRMLAEIRQTLDR